MGILPTSKQNETGGFQCLGHSNWTICSPLSPFCAKRFSTFSLSYWEANSYYPRGLIMGKGNSPNFKTGWDRGVWVPGAFKLDHLQPFAPLTFSNYSIFFTFILGRPILITPEGQLSEMGILPTSKQNETGGFQCLGHSNWIICNPLSTFCSETFLTFPPSYWEANSYYPRGPIMGKGDSSNSRIGWNRGLLVPGASKLDH